MTRKPIKIIGVTPELYNELRVRAHYGQSLGGVIQELLNSTTCQLCGKPSGGNHKECEDREAMIADIGLPKK